MFLRIIVVEDVELFLNSDVRMIKTLAKKYNVAIELETFTFAGEKLSQYIEQNEIDLAVLDIEVGNSNGIRIGRKIKKYNPFVSLVFITAHLQYIEKANVLNPAGYLTKPVKFSELDSIFCKAVMLKAGKAAIEEKNARFVTFRVERMLFEVSEREIVYIRILGRKVQVQTLGKTVLVNESLTGIEERLSNMFARVGRDALVNKSRVKRIEKYQIVMENDDVLEVPRYSYRKVVERLRG